MTSRVTQVTLERVRRGRRLAARTAYVVECMGGGSYVRLSFFVISTSEQCSRSIGGCIEWLVKRFAIWSVSIAEEAPMSERCGTFAPGGQLMVNRGDTRVQKKAFTAFLFKAT